MSIRYLSTADVVAIHSEILLRMDQSPAFLRDEGALESAVLKPQTVAFYEDADLIRQAAVLAIGIVRNHPFVDGNKRTAYLATLIFLRVNGQPLNVDYLEFAYQVEAAVSRSIPVDEATRNLDNWLRSHGS